MNTNENLFWEMLQDEEAILVIDNDCCYITFDSNEDDGKEGESFDFGPTDLVFMFAEKRDIKAEYC